jgi:hypothetical protein
MKHRRIAIIDLRLRTTPNLCTRSSLSSGGCRVVLH